MVVGIWGDAESVLLPQFVSALFRDPPAETNVSRVICFIQVDLLLYEKGVLSSGFGVKREDFGNI